MLSGKIAIITGASSGIGLAAAKMFADAGAKLVVNGRRSALLDQLVSEINAKGGDAVAIAGDVADEETHSAFVSAAQEVYGGLDIGFNNVGVVGEMKPLAEISPSEWSDVIAINLTAAFLGARAQIPAMLADDGGALIFTSSFVGNSVGLPGMAAYASAKAGLTGLVKGITADYSAQKIRANALLPGGTATAMAGDATQREWAASLHAMKRIAEPDEIAKAAMFLASDMASFVTGSTLWADGGNSAVKL